MAARQRAQRDHKIYEKFSHKRHRRQKINFTTIPADILVSSGEGSRPDLVSLDRENKQIALRELTHIGLGSPSSILKAILKAVNLFTNLEFNF